LSNLLHHKFESLCWHCYGGYKYDSHCFGSNLAIKIDIEKAFDTLDWTYIIQVSWVLLLDMLQ